MIVGAEKRPGCGAAADPPYGRASFRPPTPTLPLRARGTISFSFSFSSFSFSAGCDRLLSPFVAPAPLRAASYCLDTSPSTGRDRLPELSEPAGARGDAGTGVIEVPESVGVLEDEGAVDVPRPGDEDGA